MLVSPNFAKHRQDNLNEAGGDYPVQGLDEMKMKLSNLHTNKALMLS